VFDGGMVDVERDDAGQPVEIRSVGFLRDFDKLDAIPVLREVVAE